MKRRESTLTAAQSNFLQQDINSASFKQRSAFVLHHPATRWLCWPLNVTAVCTDTCYRSELYKRFFMNQNLYLRIKSEILFMFRWVWTRVLPFLMSVLAFYDGRLKKHFVFLKHRITNVNERWLPCLLQYLRNICRVMSRHHGSFNWKPLAPLTFTFRQQKKLYELALFRRVEHALVADNPFLIPFLRISQLVNKSNTSWVNLLFRTSCAIRVGSCGNFYSKGNSKCYAWSTRYAQLNRIERWIEP